jgi:signal transduction histidine kinase
MPINAQSPTSVRPEASSEHALAQSVLDSLDTPVLVAAPDGSIRYRNAKAPSWLPDRVDVAGTFAEARCFAPFTTWPDQLRRVFESGQTRTFDCIIRRAAGCPATLASVRCTPLREEERVTGVVIVVTEGARQEGVEEKLEVSKRLASLGKLATRVAHELNNPLDGILRYINLAMRVTADQPHTKLADYLTESRTGLLRMVQIIGELLEFSRTTDGEFDDMNINEVVEQAIKATTSGTAARGIVVAADFQSQSMPHTRGSRLYQVCCNLIKNAVDAMPDGGRLLVTTGLAGEDVLIEVADTGVGLPDPVEQVFEPFFTTKASGKGTGLGLAICKDFIEDMHGSITARPGDGGGAVFTVRIPPGAGHRPSRLAAAQDEANDPDLPDPRR